MVIGQADGLVDPKGQVADGPAVVTPPVTHPSPEKMVEQIKARLKAAANPADAKPNGEPAKSSDEPKDDKNLTIPPKVLAELGKLQAKVREFEAKSKEYEPLKTDADFAREAKKLWGGTHEEKLKALALLSGKDGLDELAALVKTYYEIEQDTPSADDKNVSPQMKAVLDQLSAITKQFEELKNEKTKEKEGATKTQAEENQKRANEYVKGFIDRYKDKFVLCSRAENVAEATEDIQDAAMTIIDRDKIDIKTMDQKTAEKVYLEALQETEAEYENTGKRFSKGGTTESRTFNPDKYDGFVRRTSRPTIVVKQDESPTSDPREIEKRLRARLQAKAEAGEYQR